MYSVSVIMPIYNNEKTMKKAIDSILNQTIYGFELILVNDGSTDNSGQICDDYAKKEPLLVEVIHQQRQGTAAARNKGLFNSSGEYVYFADPTDLFEARMLQSNVKLAKEKNADLVVFGFTTINEYVTGKVEQHLPRMPLLSDENDFRNHYRNFHHFYPHVLFNKLYKRSFLFDKRIHFHNLPVMEDAFFNLKAYKDMSSVAFNRRTHCHRLKTDQATEHPYDEHVYAIYTEYISSLEIVFTYWGAEEEFQDILAEEHYKALVIEGNSISSSNSPLTIEDQVKRMNERLSNEHLQANLHLINPSTNEMMYNRLLLSYFQSKNGSGVVDLLNRKKKTKKKSNKVTKFIRNFFK